MVVPLTELAVSVFEVGATVAEGGGCAMSSSSGTSSMVGLWDSCSCCRRCAGVRPFCTEVLSSVVEAIADGILKMFTPADSSPNCCGLVYTTSSSQHEEQAADQKAEEVWA
jgi:hypothetical protein